MPRSLTPYKSLVLPPTKCSLLLGDEQRYWALCEGVLLCLYKAVVFSASVNTSVAVTAPSVQVRPS